VVRDPLCAIRRERTFFLGRSPSDRQINGNGRSWHTANRAIDRPEAAILRPQRVLLGTMTEQPPNPTADDGHVISWRGAALLARHRRRRDDVYRGGRVWACLQPRIRTCRTVRPNWRRDEAAGLDDGRRQGQRHRVAVLDSADSKAKRSDRQHHELRSSLRDKALPKHNGVGLAGHVDGSVRPTSTATSTPAADRPSSRRMGRNYQRW